MNLLSTRITATRYNRTFKTPCPLEKFYYSEKALDILNNKGAPLP